MSKPVYMVLRRAEPGTHYVLATHRKFYRYSEAALFTQSLAVSCNPIILMI
ncbi:hypothetical protein HAP48_0042875 [Bradyrhizobium septentrionale]|uniref:Uncharacterized protein n=1 Tax=Bradyrhizobium septentrionale TaxID=1404411 RepID=A0A974A387_9BRAD|nr:MULTISPECIES: hypothetical protein [Bradyrhizobium]MCK7669147.1 hypothetical protein [Bradyrhizobium sp. 2S1]MCK7671476.1 hypothetical protein [Bradyrhizobium sp. 2S1]UGY15202.1 hypothetical protein HAP48_0042875 [Bradyrhizobium septentrionale]UGY23787.1 hypothetical protein HU675_0038550 [Bradyrhizobium septentrionale]